MIDLKPLDARIKKLQRLKEFAKEFGNDPEFLELLARLLASNSKTVKQPSESEEKVESSEKEKPKRGFFLNAVRKVVDIFPNTFTSDDIEREMRKTQFQFRAASANVAINEALRTLEHKRYVERTGKRDGSVQIIWRKTIASIESRTA